MNISDTFNKASQHKIISKHQDRPSTLYTGNRYILSSHYHNTHFLYHLKNSKLFKSITRKYINHYITLHYITLQQWRVEIGTFSCRYILRYHQNCNFFHERQNCGNRICFRLMLNFFVILYLCYILLMHGDIEVNPGPRKNCSTSFSFCHWNLNSLIAHN